MQRVVMRKCVFFDRDGVLNEDDPNYVYEVEKYKVYPEIPDIIASLKKQGFLIIVITNQAGISKGIYTERQMQACHDKLQQVCEGNIDGIYYCPYHQDHPKSNCRKPSAKMFEDAIEAYNINPAQSWMIGDRDRDLIPARKLGMKTIGVKRNEAFKYADYAISELNDILGIIGD